MFKKLWKKHSTETQVTTTDSQNEARNAIAQADIDLMAINDRQPQVDHLTTHLRDELSRNHFAEALEASMRPIPRSI